MRLGNAYVAVVLAIGCGPVVGSDGGQDSSSTSDAPGTTNPGTTDAPGTTNPGTTDTPGTTGTSTTTTDTTSTSTTSVDEVTTNDEGTFLIEPDGGGGSWLECDQFLQDCPEGEKCMPWANDGGSSWNATRCTPLDPNPAGLGEECTVEGNGVSGIDNCDIRAMCFWVDPETNMGECVPFCEGSVDEPTCADECSQCSLSGDGVLFLCLPECDPLGDDCGDGFACYPWNDTFGCYEDASGKAGAPLDPCDFVTDCDSGSYCAAQDFVPGCIAESCCTPMCDTEVADACDAIVPGAVCTPWFAQPPEGECYAGTIGVCAAPP